MLEKLFENKKLVAYAAILIVLAAISFFGLSSVASDSSNFRGTISEMDGKAEDVMALTAAASAASAAITLIPDDVGTPIAEKMADLTGYFLFVLAAIYFEKWMVTVTGFIAFRIFIPICLLILAYLLFRPSQVIKVIVFKIMAFSIIIFLIVPVSVRLSNLIDDSYEESMQMTITDAEKKAEEIHDSVEKSKTGNVITDFWKSIKGGATAEMEKYKTLFTNFIQAIAVLIVTSVAIPIAVLAFAIYLLKMIAGIELRIPDVRLSDKLNELKAS